MTFSLAGRCATTGRFGIVVTSSSPCVAARCAHVRPGFGAASSQNITDPSLGPRLLALLADGYDAREAMDAVTRDTERIEYRQLTLIDSGGGTAAWSGEQTLGRHAAAEGVDCVAAGNLLAAAGVPSAMVRDFQSSTGESLPERLVRAVEDGLAAGGEEGPVRSVGLLVVDHVSWPIADLRVDWHEQPIAELRTLWEIWRPQMDDYVTRALDPASAPSYGVPGDE